MAKPVWLSNRLKAAIVENRVPKGMLGGEGGACRTLYPRQRLEGEGETDVRFRMYWSQ